MASSQLSISESSDLPLRQSKASLNKRCDADAFIAREGNDNSCSIWRASLSISSGPQSGENGGETR
jgi:hypothetical protein